MAKKEPISITIDGALLKWVDAQWRKEGSTRSAFIERILRESRTEQRLLDEPHVKDLLGALSSKGVLGALSSALPNAPDNEQMDLVAEKLRQMRKAGSKSRKPRS